MNATERSAILNRLELYGDMAAVVDERTLSLLDRRRSTATVRRRGWLVRRLLFAADLIGLITAFFLAEWIVAANTGSGLVDARGEVLVFLASLPFWAVIAKVYRLYDHDEERTDHSTADDFGGVFHMVTVCTWLFALGSYVTGVTHPSLAKLGIFWAAAVAFVSVGRASARAIARRSELYLQNTVIVGAGDVGQLIARKLLQHPEYGLNLVGLIGTWPAKRRDGLEHVAVLGERDRLPSIIRLFDIERVIVAFSNYSDKETIELVRAMTELDVQIDIVPRMYELIGPGVGMHTVEGLPLFGLAPLRMSRSSKWLKRAMDMVLSLAGLLLLTPLFLVVALAIRFDSSGPVFFRQVRRASEDRTFRIWKFRTMVKDADEHKHEVEHLNKHLAPGGDPRMFKIVDDPRATRVGRWLRRFSLDELPQLLNVVAGDMSLVGPRPLILEEDEHVRDWARRRLMLKPGCTGPWQVLGRDGIPFEEMVNLDYLYVSNWSLFGDLKLILRTAPALLRSSEV